MGAGAEQFGEERRKGSTENGKKINSRQYSMNLTKNQPQDIKIGTRVPVEGKQGEIQYMDVGTNISGRLQVHNDQLELFVNTETTNFAIPEQATGHEPHPVMRQLKISGSTLAVLGTPMVIGSADDPNSRRQFQVEVTMTKLR
jgi:3D (Asp-Asp-Asp) domain-containing protein